jgi:hypothetical protein
VHGQGTRPGSLQPCLHECFDAYSPRDFESSTPSTTGELSEGCNSSYSDTSQSNTHSESFRAYSRSDFESSSLSKIGTWSDPSGDASSIDTSPSSLHDVLDCSFAAATAPVDEKSEEAPEPSNVIEGCVDDLSFFDHSPDRLDASTTQGDESKAVHLIGISHIYSESDSSEGSSPSLASSGCEQHGSPVSSHDSEFALNDTNIISLSSSGSHLDDVHFPSDEETPAADSSHLGDCDELWEKPEGEFAIFPDNADANEPAVLPVNTHEIQTTSDFKHKEADEDCERDRVVLGPENTISARVQLPRVTSPVMAGLGVCGEDKMDVPLIKAD